MTLFKVKDLGSEKKYNPDCFLKKSSGYIFIHKTIKNTFIFYFIQDFKDFLFSKQFWFDACCNLQ